MAKAAATVSFPFLTAYNPPGASEGTLDPLGLYQIADQLAVQLVPAVRERMLRVRFLTAMAVGALITQEVEPGSDRSDEAPYLAWEWLLVEALVQSAKNNGGLWGVPGTVVTRSALKNHGYLDARSYLKTPRIFGFNGVYKRLAIHLGIVDMHLAPGFNTEPLVDAWARDLKLGGLAGARPLLGKWTRAVRQSVSAKPARSRASWGEAGAEELASSFHPDEAGSKEKRFLKQLLLADGDRGLGALPHIWRLQPRFPSDEDFREEVVHDHLEAEAPEFGQLLHAIRSYESLARRLQDAFDILRAEAGRNDVAGYVVPDVAGDSEFRECVEGLHERFARAHRALGEVSLLQLTPQALLAERFAAFAEPMEPATVALALCTLHENVQRAKSAEGKRPWFDRMGAGRIHVRQSYRIPRQELMPDRYLHSYRGWPIRRFERDLS